jgi:hypothetical protein
MEPRSGRWKSSKFKVLTTNVITISLLGCHAVFLDLVSELGINISMASCVAG